MCLHAGKARNRLSLLRSWSSVSYRQTNPARFWPAFRQRYLRHPELVGLQQRELRLWGNLSSNRVLASSLGPRRVLAHAIENMFLCFTCCGMTCDIISSSLHSKRRREPASLFVQHKD